MSCFVMRTGRTLCDMSWDVMIGMHRAHMLRPVRHGLRVFHSVSRASHLRHGLASQSIFVPFLPPPATPGGGTLIRAYPARACAGGGARFAAARFVRLIARVREAERRAHVSRPFRGSFFAPARNRSEAASGWRLLPPARSGYCIPCVNPYFRYCSRHEEQMPVSTTREACSGHPLPPPRRPGRACRKTGEIAGQAVPQPAQTG